MSQCLLAQDAQETYERAMKLVEADSVVNAAPFFREAAESGHPGAQYNYGYCFESGTGVDQNDSIANAWYLLAADQGWVDAQFKLGHRFARGKGVERSEERSYYWTLRCALQEDIDCMYNLITCYYRGSGTPKDMDSVVVWAQLISRKASDDLSISGIITSAKLDMAQIYDKGDGLKRDPLLSYAWYLIYNETKHDHSILVQQQAVTDIERLEAELNERKRKKARSEAEGILGRGLQNFSNLHESDQ
jgi:hypothetical protein